MTSEQNIQQSSLNQGIEKAVITFVTNPTLDNKNNLENKLALSKLGFLSLNDALSEAINKSSDKLTLAHLKKIIEFSEANPPADRNLKKIIGLVRIALKQDDDSEDREILHSIVIADMIESYKKLDIPAELKEKFEKITFKEFYENPKLALAFFSEFYKSCEEKKDKFPNQKANIENFLKTVDAFKETLPIPPELEEYSNKLKSEIEILNIQANKIDADKYPEDKKTATQLAQDLETKRSNFFDKREFYDSEKTKNFQSESLSEIDKNKNILNRQRKILGQAIEVIGAVILCVTPWTIYKAVCKFAYDKNVNLPWHNPKTYQKAEKVAETIKSMPGLSR